MVASALRLIAERGVQGTSFADVLERSGAPRGSVYHHFPGGKDELVAAGMDYMATDGRATLARLDGADVAGIVSGFVGMWRGLLEGGNYAVGCSVLGVTVTAESEELRAAAGRVFETWAVDLTELLVAAGVDESSAASFAWMLIASTEGAVALARAQRNTTALDVVEQQLLRLGALLG